LINTTFAVHFIIIFTKAEAFAALTERNTPRFLVDDEPDILEICLEFTILHRKEVSNFYSQ
jgi:hypothetical protein